MKIDNSRMSQMVQQTAASQQLLGKLYEKLGTGKRINRASDDAAGLAVAKELEKMSRGYKAAGVNIGDAMSALKIAEGSSSTISDMIGRMNELSVQASNDTLNADQRSMLNNEFQQLKQEISRMAESSEFNTQDLLNGESPLSDGTGLFQVGPNSGDTVQAGEANLMASGLGIMSLDISTQAGAAGAIDGLASALDQVNETRTDLGSQINRLEYTASNNENMNTNTSAALSLIEDLDFAQALTEKATADVLSQSALLAQRNFQDISRNSILALTGQ
jgi:flagellin